MKRCVKVVVDGEEFDFAIESVYTRPLFSPTGEDSGAKIVLHMETRMDNETLERFGFSALKNAQKDDKP